MALEAGTLRVQLQYAKDIKDRDLFGKQDPYVKLRIGTQERRSRTHNRGGKNPVWDETFEFTVINENSLDLTLMDEDTVRDDLIGTSTVSLAQARERPGAPQVVQAPVGCSHSGNVKKQHGYVQVTITFTPNSSLKPGGAAPVAQAASFAYPAAPPPPAYGYPTYAPPPPPPAPGPYGYYPAPSYHYAPPPPSPAPSFAYGAAPPPSYAPPPPAAGGYYPPPPAPAPSFAYGAAPPYGAPPPPYGAPPPPYGAPPGPYGVVPPPPYYPPPPQYGGSRSVPTDK